MDLPITPSPPLQHVYGVRGMASRSQTPVAYQAGAGPYINVVGSGRYEWTPTRPIQAQNAYWTYPQPAEAPVHSQPQPQLSQPQPQAQPHTPLTPGYARPRPELTGWPRESSPVRWVPYPHQQQQQQPFQTAEHPIQPPLYSLQPAPSYPLQNPQLRMSPTTSHGSEPPIPVEEQEEASEKDQAEAEKEGEGQGLEMSRIATASTIVPDLSQSHGPSPSFEDELETPASGGVTVVQLPPSTQAPPGPTQPNTENTNAAAPRVERTIVRQGQLVTSPESIRSSPSDSVTPLRGGQVSNVGNKVGSVSASILPTIAQVKNAWESFVKALCSEAGPASAWTETLSPWFADDARVILTLTGDDSLRQFDIHQALFPRFMATMAASNLHLRLIDALDLVDSRDGDAVKLETSDVEFHWHGNGRHLVWYAAMTSTWITKGNGVVLDELGITVMEHSRFASVGEFGVAQAALQVLELAEKMENLLPLLALSTDDHPLPQFDVSDHIQSLDPLNSSMDSLTTPPTISTQ